MGDRAPRDYRPPFGAFLATEMVDRDDDLGRVARIMVSLPGFDRAASWRATKACAERNGRPDLIPGLRQIAAERREAAQSWQPFTAGNTAAVTHGANTPELVTPIADALEAELRTVAPWVEGEAFTAEVRSWAWSEAQARLLRAWLDEHGVLDPDGQPRPATTLLRQVESSAAKRRDALGLNPQAMVKLLAGLTSVDPAGARSGLDALRESGRRIREAAELRALATGSLPTPEPATDTEVIGVVVDDPEGVS